MSERIKELSMAIATTDLHILLEEIKQLKANLSLELQAIRDDRRMQQQEFNEFMTHLVETLDQIRAKHLIDAQLLDLIGSDNAGDHHEEKERGATETQKKTGRVSSYRQ